MHTTKAMYREQIKNLQSRNHTLVFVVFIFLLLNIGQLVYTIKIIPDNINQMQVTLEMKNNTIKNLKQDLANEKYEVKKNSNEEK